MSSVCRAINTCKRFALRLVLIASAHVLYSAAHAQPPAASPNPAVPWTILAEHSQETLNGTSWVRPLASKAIALNRPAMFERLADAPLEFSPDYRRRSIIIELPAPDGTYKFFEVFESPILPPALQAMFPQIRTYVGQGLTTRAETLRMDMTPAGFHAQVLGPQGTWYIDPVTRGDTTNYASYFLTDLGEMHPFQCLTTGANLGGGLGRAEGDGPVAQESNFIGPVLRTYRLSVTTTGEYAAFHGGTLPGTLAAVVTVVNRVSGIYEREVGVRLQLAPNNDLVIFTNAASDPYTNPGANTTTMNAAQVQFDTLIGGENYDVGHLFHRGPNNGIAGAIGNVCIAGTIGGTSGKGRGISVSDSPVGDPFSVNYVAHELGHQFGARHTFNFCTSGPGDDPLIAHEPGSGSTIMGYAGLCNTNNLQSNSDAMFASINFDQITSFLAGAGDACALLSQSGNTAPFVDGGSDYVIPVRTPFELRTLTAFDPDADPLTYSWEQRSGGTAVALPISDIGTNPLFRVYAPSTNPIRTLPRLSNLLNYTLPSGEALPTTSRTMAWRVTVRDNRAGGAGVNFDDVNITTVSTAGPFRVTSPSGAVTWTAGTPQSINWNVAGTTGLGINTANVRVLFSTDGGNTWPTVLLDSTPNDGFELITVPVVATSQGRIRIEAIDNIFFNINQGGLITVVPALPGIDIVRAGNATIIDTIGNGNSTGTIDPGESSIALLLPIRNQGLTDATGITGALTSLTSTVNITQASAAYPDASGPSWNITNLTPFEINVTQDHACGAPITLRLSLATNQITPTPIDFTLSTGVQNGPGPQVRYQYAGAPVAVPDNSAMGANASITITDAPGTISDVNFSFDGSNCSAAPGSTTVGLTHNFVGDLAISLISPSGTAVLLSNRRGSSGNNMCNTVFDDSASTPIGAATATGNPWSGTYSPDQPLSVLNGQLANGIWTLRVVDVAAPDAGVIRNFSIYLRTQLPATCQPPLPTQTCDSIDFNNDQATYDPRDIEAFLSVFSEGPCIPEGTQCNDIDFNNDGESFDPLDITAFLRVFAEGAC